MCFVSIYSVLIVLSEYAILYLSKNITSNTFLLVFKIVESLQFILKTGIFSLAEQYERKKLFKKA